jgi:hypothetical protein
MAFVMVLSCSRQIFLCFFLDARMESFLRGHVAPFTAWNGCARDAAIREAIARGVPHPNAVRLALEHRRELRNEAPPVAVILPEHVKARDAHVQPHRLEPYDQSRYENANLAGLVNLQNRHVCVVKMGKDGGWWIRNGCNARGIFSPPST